jgi:ABC-type nitrate/sulfonate/bicarbonate transport system ATPase subunit
VSRPLSQEPPASAAAPAVVSEPLPPDAAARAFECDNVSLEFSTSSGPLTVLQNVGFTVAEGEFVSIVGQSGTGKTTLLRVLGGLQQPAEGSRVLHHGKPVTEPPSGVIVVFQDYRGSLLPWRTVERNVMLGLEGELDAAERRERCESALELVGLADRAKDYPWKLSGGMQQRVQIARALAMRPRVLLMDEPFGALDAMTKAQLQDELQTVHKVTGTTIVFVTHDIEEAVYLSDRVLVLADRPASIAAEVTITLPRPRDQITTKELPEYLEFRHTAHVALRGQPDGHR